MDYDKELEHVHWQDLTHSLYLFFFPTRRTKTRDVKAWSHSWSWSAWVEKILVREPRSWLSRALIKTPMRLFFLDFFLTLK